MTDANTAVTTESTDSVAIDKLVDRAVLALTDSSRNNPLLYYRQSSSTRFTLPPLGSDFITKLLNAGALTAADFEPVASSFVETKAPVPDAGPAKPVRRVRTSTSSPLQTRLQKMRAKARENEEERGLQTLYAAIGMVTWPATDGGRPPCAPLFLVPMAVEEDKSTRGQLVARRIPDGEIVFNRAILALAPDAFRSMVAELFEGGIVDDVPEAYQRVADAVARGNGAVRLEPTCALGIFNFSMMAVVTDLDEARDELGDHIIIRALAGDQEARDTLARAREGAVEVTELDSFPPPDEPFVLDADPWQARTIHTLRRFEDSHATIDGPPGTGKSQTIANLIASFVAQGKSVLFCCEKRAALDVVARRLAAAGLGHLVLDLHGAGVTRQRAYDQLKRSRRAVSEAVVPSAALDPQLLQTRGALLAHDRFMHGPIGESSETPFALMAELMTLPAFDISLRLNAQQLEKLGPQFTRLESDVTEAARWPAAFRHQAGLPWASARKVRTAQVPTALDAVAKASAGLGDLQDQLASIGIEVGSREQLVAAITALRPMRALLSHCSPSLCAIDAATGELAAKTIESPFRPILELFSNARRQAIAAALPGIGSTTGRTAAAALRVLTKLDDPWRSHASQIAALPPAFDALVTTVLDDLTAAERWLESPLPPSISEAQDQLATHAHERDAAYRIARMNDIQANLADAGLRPFVALCEKLDPASWPLALRYVYLQSLLEPLRPELIRFDGRTQDGVVAQFTSVETRLRTVAGDRVRRNAAKHFIDVTQAFRDETTTLNVQLERVRSKKPLRKLFEEAPNALTALAPCIMASPLTVSQFLPRRQFFDVVVFDEGSQMAPESAITAILRGKRVVIAGDDRQLPPTSFFAAAIDEDDVDESDRDATAGTESILAALRPFTKPLGLRVHYRSRDERLIAFSNHYLYDESLVTFPGPSRSASDIRLVHVDPSGVEADENSSSPEVVAVVDLIIEHAETKPHVSLGVIALGSTHATRIETHLAEVRKTRPDLDDFFDDTKQEAFFVKNLERVQGDERDAIILTIGYGRTKTGAVSHNFGPINQVGGERRLNVAITRAKYSVTLVSSFRKADLNPSSLNSQGAKLLAAYLGYAETNGQDLGRDGVDAEVAPSGIELDVQQSLERALGTTILPQYGVGKFRIDLAVQHPKDPGRFVLAVEFDGASYHSTPTARLRDRQRQQVLEDLGWTFCRIWSTDWFNNREGEIARVRSMYEAALQRDNENSEPRTAQAPAETSEPQPAVHQRVGICPVARPRSIADVTDAQLKAVLDWIASDGCLRTDDELFEEMQTALDFARRGARIVERFDAAIAWFRKQNPSA